MPNSYYNSPLGWLEIETNNNELTCIFRSETFVFSLDVTVDKNVLGFID